MPDSIRDGEGKGYLAGVTNENRLKIGGVTVSKEHHTNFAHEDSYNMLFTVTPTGAGDYFLYMKNTSTDPIVCEGFQIQAPTNEIISITLGMTGTPVGGSTTLPSNLYAGSPKRAVGTFETGADITGLSGGMVVAKYAIAASNESKFRNFDADIVIPQNQTLTMSATTGAIALLGFIVMWHDHGGI
jgi:hypothetical protein